MRLVYRPGKKVVLADTLSRTCNVGTLLHEDLETDPLLHTCNIAIKSQETSLKYANATELDKELSVAQ